VQRSIWDCDDPRVKLELLSRIYASEFAKTAERKIEPEQVPERKVSIAVVLNTGGKSLEQLAHFLSSRARKHRRTSKRESQHISINR
jgi:hypothetical protein